jgi:two-component system nitrogen regulation sensor histidine kinase GlnL
MPERSANPFGGLDLLSSSVVLLDDELAIRYLNSAAENLLEISNKALPAVRSTASSSVQRSCRRVLHNVLNHAWGYRAEYRAAKRRTATSCT